MGSSESKLTQEKRQMEEKAFVVKWPQNARSFSGNKLRDQVYVVIVYGSVSKTLIPWLAFETRSEADKCLREGLHTNDPYIVVPFVYGSRRDAAVYCWISVVSRQQAQDEGLYCETTAEVDDVEGYVPPITLPSASSE